MSKQIKAFQTQNENSVLLNDANRFSTCEEVVDALVQQGIPSSFSPDNFISKISKNYNISFQEARTCLKLALKQLENKQNQENSTKEEKLYAQSGYYYPQGYSKPTINAKHDGLDSLSSLSSYNRLMFGLK